MSFKLIEVEGRKMLYIDVPYIERPQDYTLLNIDLTRTMQEDIDSALSEVQSIRDLKQRIVFGEHKKGCKP